MEILDRKQLKKRIPAPIHMEKVELPEWDSFCYVRRMSVMDLDCFEAEQRTLVNAHGEGGRYRNFRVRYITHCACDETGKLIFVPEDAEWLGEREEEVLQRLFDRAQEVNAIKKDTEKNSESAPSEDSSTD